MTTAQIAILAAAVVLSLAFVLFWFAPAHTSRTFALLFSAIRHVLALKREAKGEPPKPTGKIRNPGTISEYLSRDQREAIQERRRKQEDQ